MFLNAGWRAALRGAPRAASHGAARRSPRRQRVRATGRRGGPGPRRRRANHSGAGRVLVTADLDHEAADAALAALQDLGVPRRDVWLLRLDAP
jgi:hypothetical protein